jgi:hypothetical protein
LFNTPAKSLGMKTGDDLGKHGLGDGHRRCIPPLERESITHSAFTKPQSDSHFASFEVSLTGH